MDFHFRDSDVGPRRLSLLLSRPGDRRFAPQAGPGHFHGGPPPPPPQAEWEAAARREQIIREEVERRLIEEEVCRELAVARARLHGGFGPEPFFRPDGPFLPPPPGPLFGVDVPFMPPPMPPGMHPNGPLPALFGPWQGSGPRRCSGFGERKLVGEARRRPLPPSKLKHKLEPLMAEPDGSSEILSSKTKVSSVKSKVDTDAVTPEPTPSSEANISGMKRKADVIAAAPEPTKLEKPGWDWSCALCQVRATSEASLNTHLEGKKHKAKLAKCGVIKAIGDCKNGFQTTTGNKDSGCSTDPPRKICILVDGVMNEVVQKSNYLWCERCRVRCENNMTMVDHLRGKKHSEFNKVWKSIKAVRLNKRKEGISNREVNENGPIKTSEEGKKEGAYITNELNENGEINVEMKKETTDMAEEVNENSLTETPVEIKKEDTASEVNRNIASEVNRNGDIEIPMETEHKDADIASKISEKNSHIEVVMDFKQKGIDMVMGVNRNGFTEIPAKDMNKGANIVVERNENCFSEIPIETSKETAGVPADMTHFVPKEE